MKVFIMLLCFLSIHMHLDYYLRDNSGSRQGYQSK